MKKVKVNFLLLAAMLVAVGTFAFRSPATLQSGWYEVQNQETILGAIEIPSAQCKAEYVVDLCAVNLDLSVNPNMPETVTEADGNGQIIERAFREDL
jgi:hypothetical protein